MMWPVGDDCCKSQIKPISRLGTSCYYSNSDPWLESPVRWCQNPVVAIPARLSDTRYWMGRKTLAERAEVSSNVLLEPARD